MQALGKPNVLPAHKAMDMSYLQGWDDMDYLLMVEDLRRDLDDGLTSCPAMLA